MTTFLNCRRYAKFYGANGDAAANLAHDAILGNVKNFSNVLIGDNRSSCSSGTMVWNVNG